MGIRILGRRRPRRPWTPVGPGIVLLSRQAAVRERQQIEDLSRRLRRIRCDLADYARQEFLPGKRNRITACRLAYVDLLIETCALVGVDHQLQSLSGFDRQLEVLRVEGELADFGVDLRV